MVKCVKIILALIIIDEALLSFCDPTSTNSGSAIVFAAEKLV